MEKKYVFRFVLAVIVSAFLFACNTKKQAVHDARTPIVFEPLVSKGIDTFRFSYEPPNIISIPKIGTAQDNYEMAYQELEAMLNGTKTPDFERAVFISENPYYNNRYPYGSFQKAISIHLDFIHALIQANDKSESIDFNATVNKNGRFKLEDIRHLPSEKKELYQKVLSNWAVFTYITDTTAIHPFFHLPFNYAGNDPFGINNWSNSQVIGLLLSKKQQGNCFALTAFYKILSDRLNSGARLCTAPQHIYIQHQDSKGDYYNVELATAGHPTDGTVQTLTHTTSTAIRSGIALRSYDEKQSIGLCLINLAKSYEHTFNNKGHEFLLRCAELVLKYDSLNLNALLLKQQVLDERVATYATQNNMYNVSALKKDPEINKKIASLEYHIATLYRLGYRQMPIDMQKIIMTGIYPETIKDKNPSPFTTIDPKDPHRKEFQSSYHGLFQEVFEQKEIEKYGHCSFSTKSNSLVGWDTSTKNNMLIDPVAFAYDFGARIYDARLGRWLSTDPLGAEYPGLSPYNFVANSPIYYVDPDGKKLIPSNFFVNSVYYGTLLTIIDSRQTSTFVTKYLSEFMGDDKDLYLRFNNTEGPGATARTTTVDQTDELITFNANEVYNVLNESGEAGYYNVKSLTELGKAVVIMHEVIIHADRKEGDHIPPTGNFDDLVTSLKEFSSGTLNSQLSDQDAVALALVGFSKNDIAQLQNHIKTKYNIDITKDMVDEAAKRLMRKDELVPLQDIQKNQVNEKKEEDQAPIETE